MSVSTLNKRLKILLGLNALFIAVFVVDLFMGGALRQFGILPRDTSTWYHIFTAPFIHGSPLHLMNNMIGFSILGAVCLIRSANTFALNSLGIITIGGLLVWAFGRESYHIGASGWIFGLWSLAIATAWFNRKLIYIAAALVVLFFYGGMFFGMLPGKPHISFESHLFGAVAGVICAFLTAKRR